MYYISSVLFFIAIFTNVELVVGSHRSHSPSISWLIQLSPPTSASQASPHLYSSRTRSCVLFCKDRHALLFEIRSSLLAPSVTSNQWRRARSASSSLRLGACLFRRKTPQNASRKTFFPFSVVCVGYSA